MKVLITGFDPFGGEQVNPAYESVKLLPDRLDTAAGRVDIVRAEIPTQFHRSIERVKALIAEHRPDVVLCVGQAGGRSGVTPERVAINIDDARIADNAGAQPIDEPIVESGAPAYFATVPVKAIVCALEEAGIPASLSNSAGTYVCNHVMYGLLHHLAAEHPAVRGGFIHVPYSAEQVADRPHLPALPLRTIADGLAIAIRVCAEQSTDVRAAFGETH